MSLDLALYSPESVTETCRCPDCGNEHVRTRRSCLFDTNITHNLGSMFKEAGCYEILWHGDGKRAADCLPTLREGLRQMKMAPARFKAFDSPNGWGRYVHAVPWLREVIASFEANPDGVLSCSR